MDRIYDFYELKWIKKVEYSSSSIRELVRCPYYPGSYAFLKEANPNVSQLEWIRILLKFYVPELILTIPCKTFVVGSILLLVHCIKGLIHLSKSQTLRTLVIYQFPPQIWMMIPTWNKDRVKEAIEILTNKLVLKDDNNHMRNLENLLFGFYTVRIITEAAYNYVLASIAYDIQRISKIEVRSKDLQPFYELQYGSLAERAKTVVMKLPALKATEIPEIIRDLYQEDPQFQNNWLKINQEVANMQKWIMERHPEIMNAKLSVLSPMLDEIEKRMKDLKILESLNDIKEAQVAKMNYDRYSQLHEIVLMRIGSLIDVENDVLYRTQDALNEIFGYLIRRKVPNPKLYLICKRPFHPMGLTNDEYAEIEQQTTKTVLKYRNESIGARKIDECGDLVKKYKVKKNDEDIGDTTFAKRVTVSVLRTCLLFWILSWIMEQSVIPLMIVRIIDEVVFQIIPEYMIGKQFAEVKYETNLTMSDYINFVLFGGLDIEAFILKQAKENSEISSQLDSKIELQTQLFNIAVGDRKKIHQSIIDYLTRQKQRHEETKRAVLAEKIVDQISKKSEKLETYSRDLQRTPHVRLGERIASFRRWAVSFAILIIVSFMIFTPEAYFFTSEVPLSHNYNQSNNATFSLLNQNKTITQVNAYFPKFLYSKANYIDGIARFIGASAENGRIIAMKDVRKYVDWLSNTKITPRSQHERYYRYSIDVNFENANIFKKGFAMTFGTIKYLWALLEYNYFSIGYVTLTPWNVVARFMNWKYSEEKEAQLNALNDHLTLLKNSGHTHSNEYHSISKQYDEVEIEAMNENYGYVMSCLAEFPKLFSHLLNGTALMFQMIDDLRIFVFQMFPIFGSSTSSAINYEMEVVGVVVFYDVRITCNLSSPLSYYDSHSRFLEQFLQNERRNISESLKYLNQIDSRFLRSEYYFVDQQYSSRFIHASSHEGAQYPGFSTDFALFLHGYIPHESQILFAPSIRSEELSLTAYEVIDPFSPSWNIFRAIFNRNFPYFVFRTISMMLLSLFKLLLYIGCGFLVIVGIAMCCKK